MPDINNGYNPTAEQQQNMDNLSFDRKYLVNGVEILTENEAGTEIVRQKPLATSSNQTDGSQKTQVVETIPTDTTHLNPSVAITEVTVGTVTTKTIQKTIGTDVYQKTVAIDSSDNSISISVWSKL